MSDDEGGADEGNIEIYLRIKPIANPSKKVEYDLAEGKARGRCVRRCACAVKRLRVANAVGLYAHNAACHAEALRRRWRAARTHSHAGDAWRGSTPRGSGRQRGSERARATVILWEVQG
jgi:hypothetical protein